MLCRYGGEGLLRECSVQVGAQVGLTEVLADGLILVIINMQRVREQHVFAEQVGLLIIHGQHAPADRLALQLQVGGILDNLVAPLP